MSGIATTHLIAAAGRKLGMLVKPVVAIGGVIRKNIKIFRRLKQQMGYDYDLYS